MEDANKFTDLDLHCPFEEVSLAQEMTPGTRESPLLCYQSIVSLLNLPCPGDLSGKKGCEGKEEYFSNKNDLGS